MSRLVLNLLLLALFVELSLAVLVTGGYYYTIFLVTALLTIGILTLQQFTMQREKKGEKRRREILAFRLLIAAVAIITLLVLLVPEFPPYCSWVRLFLEEEDILHDWVELYNDAPGPTLIIGISTALAIITGRIVCGWVCPVGFMQDYLKTLDVKNRLRARAIGILDRVKQRITSLGLLLGLGLLGLPVGLLLGLLLGLGPLQGILLGLLLWFGLGLLQGLLLEESRIADRIDSLLRKWKYLILAGITLYALIEALGAFEILPPHRKGTATELLIKDLISNLHVFFNEFLKLITLQGITLLGLAALLVLIASIFVPRFWCRYICPYGAFLNIVGKVKFLGLRYNDSCRRSEGCRACLESCPMKVKEVGGSDCTMCGECIGHCPWHAIDYSTAWPPDTRDAKPFLLSLLLLGVIIAFFIIYYYYYL